MASEVDIANLALSHLGDTATVSSLNPPEGSAQAEHCARFYPMARDTLLQSYAWSFASRRAQLAELTSEWSSWDYCYAKPSDCLAVRAIIPADSMDDNKSSFQPFVMEVNSTDTEVIYTDQANAVCLYTRSTVDSGKFPPLFVMALSYQLSALLAGALIKGDVGSAEAKRCAQLAIGWAGKAIEADANQRKVDNSFTPSWIGAR